MASLDVGAVKHACSAHPVPAAQVTVNSPLAVEAAKLSSSSEPGTTVAPHVHAETVMSKLQLPLGGPRTETEAEQPAGRSGYAISICSPQWFGIKELTICLSNADLVGSRSTHEESEESLGSARSSTAG